MNFTFFKDPAAVDMMMIQSFDAVIANAKEWDGFENFTDKLESFKTSFLPRILATYAPNRHGFNVLNHGDFHLKNLIFKKKDDEEIDDFYVVSLL